MVKKIQHRLTVILMSLPPRERHKTRTSQQDIPRGPSISEILVQSTHIVHTSPSRVSCARCRNSFALSDPSAKHWLMSACSAIATSADRPVPLPFEEIHIGNKFTHISHQLMEYRGLVYCRKCGCRSARAVLRNLGSKCSVPSQTYGVPSLKALREGRLPPGLTGWPDGMP